MKFAYADPPYVGQAKRHYGMPEVDHEALIASLVQEYPDGWALSASAPSLRLLMPMCPDEVRVGIWVKPFASFKPGVDPAYAWEPVIFMGGRKRGRDISTMRDWHSANITMKKGTHGAKPESFCHWVFDWWNVQLGDELVDLFPGSGAVTAAWETYCISS